MIDKDKLIANWGKLKDETKALILALADKEIKEEYFVPKDRETYWTSYINPDGTCSAIEYSYDGDAYDEYLIKINNCFRTREEAIFYSICNYNIKRFEAYVDMRSKKLDWNNVNQPKYYIYYNFKKGDIGHSFSNLCKSQGTVYASSEQILKDAINDIGEENFLKYVMKVEA
ncbi:MAG: hypothetical protein RR405_01510 [Clostridia bacterium]